MIELKHISFSYGKEEILHDISASFEKGKLISVIGANGCGKSTLLKTMIGILRPSSGEILIDGQNLNIRKSGEIAKKIAYLPQTKPSFDMTVRQTVLHGRFPHLQYPRIYSKKDREIADFAMEQMGVDAYRDMPLGELSGGMRQNVYLAMALAQDTDYILLDEPTTFLDIAHQLSLLKTLRTLAEGGKGILTVLHDLPLALNASDTILVMKDGKAEAFGDAAEIYRKKVIEALFGVSIVRSEDGLYQYRYQI